MSIEEKAGYPDPRQLAERYLDQSEKYSELGMEVYRFHSRAGKELFIRYRFYLLGLMVAGIAFAILNRDISSILFDRWPEITTVRAALCFWAIGVAVGLFSIQTTITSYFVDARDDMSIFFHKAQFSALAGQQNQRIARGAQADPGLENEMSELAVRRENESAKIHKEKDQLIDIEFWQSSVCAGCFFFGAAIFAIPMFK